MEDKLVFIALSQCEWQECTSGFSREKIKSLLMEDSWTAIANMENSLYTCLNFKDNEHSTAILMLGC